MNLARIFKIEKRVQRRAIAFAASAAVGLLPLSSRSQTCLAPPSGLVSWLPGESDGSDIVGTNNGTLHGIVSFAAGKVGQAFYLDGTSGYISIPASASLNVGTNGGLTLECWILPNAVDSPQPLAEWNNGSGTVGVHFWISQPTPYGTGPGCLFANVVDSSGGFHFITSAAGVLVSGALQHVALTYDKPSGVAVLYCNGVVVATQDLGSFTPRTIYNLFLGSRPSNTELFGGLIDDFSLYGRVLSAAEIQALYSADSAGKCVGPCAPQIIVQPQDQAVLATRTATFRVAAGGSTPLSYQWHFNGANLAGATTSVLVINRAQSSHAGSYSVTVTNPVDSVTSFNAVLTVSNLPPCASIFSNLVAWWQGEGEAGDALGLNHGTIHGGVTFSSGNVEQAFSLDGNSGYISMPASASLNVGTNSGLTIEGWIKPNSVASPRPIVEWNNGSGTFGPHFWISQSTPLGSGPGCLYANIVDAGGGFHFITSAADLLSTNAFQHVALTYDKASGVATIYCNGVPVAADNLGSFTPRTIYNLYLGARPSTGDRLGGLLDEVSLYSRALSASEIQALYQADGAGKCALPPGILAHPQNRVASVGTNVTFASTASGSHPLTYQWRRNTANILGATNASLTLTNVQPSNAGSYSVVVSNSISSATSSNAILKVNVVFAFGNGVLLTNSPNSFSGPVTVQLQNLYTNGLIFYTLDGSTPTFTSNPYTSPFTLSHNSVLRALGYSSDFLQSGELDPTTILIVPVYSLTSSTSGGGTVGLNPPGGAYLSNSTVTVTATPASGWSFLQWLGDASGVNPVTNVVMRGNRNVQAVFGTMLGATAPGGGIITLSPPGGLYPYGTVVALTAMPDAGNYLALWGTGGNVNPLYVTVTNANQTISALFAPLSGGQAGLVVIPNGHGKVTVNPRANAYSIGAGVTLTAVPDASQSFLGWSGDASGTNNPLSITMDQSKTITANFTKKPILTTTRPLNGMTDQGFRFTLDGEFGGVYQIYSATGLVNWLPGTIITNPYGKVQFVDPAGISAPRIFYRALQLP